MGRRLLASALVMAMPCGGMRVVCVDAPVDASASLPATQAAPAEHPADRDQLCPWPRPAESEGGSDCALTGDGASFVIMTAASTLPPLVVPPIEIVASEGYPEAPPSYVEPGLAHLSPPPKG